MHRLPVIALLLLLARPAPAETLYRCVARDGAVSYQSQPCLASARLDRVVEYRPEPVAKVERLPVRPVSTRRGLRHGHRTTTAGHASRTTAADRCRAAQAKRSATLERLGLKRTYVRLSRLDASVRAACD